MTTLENEIDSIYYASRENKETPKMVDWKQHQPKLHADQIQHQPELYTDLILAISNEHGEYKLGLEWVEVTAEEPEEEADTFTRQTNPFSQKQVNALLKAITIGEDLSEEQKKKVHNLIAMYADCFTLSVTEVIPVKDATLDLSIPEGTQLPVKMYQYMFTPPQR
jgi:hypothetical protein